MPAFNLQSALGALQGRGDSLEFGEAFDDPTSGLVKRYVEQAGGDYAAAAKAAWNAREKQREQMNRAGGSPSMGIPGPAWMNRGSTGNDVQMLQTAMKLRNLAASAGKTQGGYTEAPRPDDPRLTQQGRNQFGRLAQQALQQRSSAIDQQQRQAEGDAQRLAEQRRMQVEGDAWEAKQAAAAQAARAASPSMFAPQGAVGALTARR